MDATPATTTANPTMNRKSHWQSIYATKETTSLSWYQLHPQRSLDLIERTAVAKTAKIVDVGGRLTVRR